MKNFSKKSILQKTIIAILVALLLFNFISPTVIAADSDDNEDLKDVGGVLFRPIQYFTLGISDTLMYLANVCAYGWEVDPILTLNTSTMTWYERAASIAGLIISGPVGWATASTIVAIDLIGNGGENTEEAVLELFPEKIDLPIFLVSPEKIFAGEVPLLDVNILNPREDFVDSNGEKITTPVQALQGTISSWYIALRNLAIVGLLSVLVYVGIRIILSSTASDKAKYKQMFTDWLIALCLLFFLHYIMSFSITMVESVTESIKGSCQRVEIPLTVDGLNDKYKITDDQKELLKAVTNENDKIELDLMGVARFKAQIHRNVQGENGENIVAQSGKSEMAYTIIYFVLVIYTIMFLFIYIKRLVYIIFLTMIAPLVALTYPIDKMNDGQAQAFNMWLKEYIFNLLIQPLHLLIYMVLLGSAMELATQYMIYPLVVLGFMLQAEKILRKFFGFEKSSTASSIASGALGGAAVMSAINKLGSGAKKAVKGGKGASSSGNDGNDNRIRMAERKADNPDNEDNFIAESLNGSSDIENENNEQKALDRYAADGYGQNANGEYYNPWTDEYDTDYNPANDSMYAKTQENEDNKNNENDNIDFNVQDNNDDNSVDTMDTSSEDNSKDNKTHFFRGIKSLAGKYVAPNLGKAGLGLLKGTATAIGAGTLGTIGIAAGLASDDFSNVVKYGGAAGAIGASIGGRAGNRLINMPSNAYRKGSEVLDTYKQGAYSKEKYKEFVNKRLDNEFMRSKENQALYREKFGTEKMENSNGEQVAAYKVAMEKALEYRAQGVTDNDIIIKAMKVKTKYGNNDDLADKRKIVSAKFASQVSNEKDVENLQKRLKEKGIAEPQIQDQANMIRKIRGLY